MVSDSFTFKQGLLEFYVVVLALIDLYKIHTYVSIFEFFKLVHTLCNGYKSCDVFFRSRSVGLCGCSKVGSLSWKFEVVMVKSCLLKK